MLIVFTCTLFAVVALFHSKINLPATFLDAEYHFLTDNRNTMFLCLGGVMIGLFCREKELMVTNLRR